MLSTEQQPPITTTGELADLLRQLRPPTKAEMDITKLRYVLYARKSTKGKDRQERSIEDQIADCLALKTRLNLNVVAIIREEETAKGLVKRPRFYEMIEAIQKGKYNAILAWHPDRLARNMKDAGEIIDLLDKKIIKDLKFVSFTFENNTMGKMLLGIAFVLSKQYSDQLSDNVKRGIRRSLEEGKYLSKAKHGYIKDRNQMLRPDGTNYNLIKQAFKMRLEDKTLDEIALFLNTHHYSKANTDGAPHKFCKMDKKNVSQFLRDPFYAGVLVYGNSLKDLAETNPDLVPMITVDEFQKINKSVTEIARKFKLSKTIHPTDSVKANLLRGMVICGDCHEPMVAGITPKKGKDGAITRYFYYRCDTAGCPKRSKSIRAKVITEFVYQFLREHKFTNRSVYDHFIIEMKKVTKQKAVEYDSLHCSLIQAKKKAEDKFEKTKTFLLEEKEMDIKEHFKRELRSSEIKLKEISEQITKLETEQEKNNHALPTFQEYLELFENVAEKLEKMTSMEDLDYSIRKFFLNFTIKDQKVAEYTIKSPFREFIEKGFVTDSRGSGT